ncbi:MAG: tRNA (adenosine(37)-N6)-threonylcarbamoyltransferase complex ATPase subunit type 1 TsaE [Candidatus Colwellbacteria bacterium RIFCSPLOWO2_12_FULL_44_13]|uniref:tRNA threonylcarbamoyladenosine biosynthesis protein TsaE n=1 Tax=Candidatus Colwellbacteria bacterium RIFCSPLOWO2_12_FULL_44_13 TaxID=1797694 RepID=A0A1G1ZAF2_9BACT|nr:MAG: tRNA (adenosine(37)-N6)-threonylcarbamoyltransferase complex ATPase subunit type 1 TsaE [Candidatus Colwellbacteria bacterium RIFCSPLOWO2_12_FULL_44_13]
MRRHTTRKALETQRFARILFSSLRRRKLSHALVVALQGELGAGKTTFVQGLLRSLGVKQNILSPTFVIMKRFSLRNRKTHFRNVYHIDAYRIHPRDLVALNIHTIFEDPNTLVVVEWAERIKKLLPPETIWLQFKHGKSEEERVIIVE